MHIHFSVLQLESISFFPLTAIYFDVLKMSIKISATTIITKDPNIYVTSYGKNSHQKKKKL